MPPQTLLDLVNIFLDLLNLLLPVLVGIAILVFIWGIILFIARSGDAASHEQGRKFMIWSVIALFALVSFYGIIEFFYHDLGFSRPLGVPVLPLLPGGP